jgi:ABC-type long-subunit fatty acid transport system fused permease/ATPase subunit
VPDQVISQIMEGQQILVSTSYTGLHQIRCVYKILMHWHKTINTESIEEKKREERKKRIGRKKERHLIKK